MVYYGISDMILTHIDIGSILTRRVNLELVRRGVLGEGGKIFYYAGSQSEISDILTNTNKSAKFMYPAVFDIVPQKVSVSGFQREHSFSICIVNPVIPNSTSQEREKKTFSPLLRPIYEEFIAQIMKAEFLEILSYGVPSHDYYDNYATSDDQDMILAKYNDVISAIEIHNLKLTVNTNLCDDLIINLKKEGCR
ncbi:hypothetical protein D0T49_04255 [Paludibacter sp. 221]|nr:hypothetical protein [Paludibacter sp. 221]